MKPFAVMVMAAAMLGAAACDESPTDPDNNTVVFTATLTAANEVPPVTGAEANATGTVTITMELTRNASNAITAAEANFNASVANMPAGSSLILAHIHTGAAGSTGGVLVNTGLSAASPIAIAGGTASFTRGDIVVDAAAAQNMIDNPAGFYFNIHSVANPGGVVRGQLVRQGS